MRQVYWDSVLVVDNELDEKLMQDVYDELLEVHSTLQKNDVEHIKYDAYIMDDFVDDFHRHQTEEKNNYTKLQKEFLAHLKGLDVIPELENHDVSYHFRAHQMKKGGQMPLHQDVSYSLAVSIYLSGCLGGELEAHRFPQDCAVQEAIQVKPRRNRMAIMKCSTEHKVLEVKFGTRESIQLFVTYLAREQA